MMQKACLISSLTLGLLLTSCGGGIISQNAITAPSSGPRILGFVELAFNSDGSTKTKFSSLGVVADNTIVFTPPAIYDNKTVATTKYLSGTFGITANQSFNNLALIAVNRTTNLGGTALNNAITFATTAVTPAVAQAVQPSHGVDNAGAVDATRANLFLFTPAESAALEAQAKTDLLMPAANSLLEYGYMAQNSSGGRSFTNGQTGQVAITVKFPAVGPNSDPYRFSLIFLAVDLPNSQARVIQSSEEQGNNALVTTRATAVAAPEVGILDGSTYAGATVGRSFCGVRTAGTAAVPLATFGAACPELLITEIGSMPNFLGVSGWFEVYNTTNAAINLSGYTLRANSLLQGSPFTIQPQNYVLPAVIVQPGAYAVVSGRVNTNQASGPRLAMLSNGVTATDYEPWYQTNTFIELVRNAGGATVDFVRVGTNLTAPTTASAWKSGAAPANPSSRGQALVRNRLNTDTNTGANWVAVPFATPGGLNDVPVGAVDLDPHPNGGTAVGDGIPDYAEDPATPAALRTFAGIDYYAMGARTNQTDVFMEIDYMQDPVTAYDSYVPQKETLQRATAMLLTQNIAIHIDAGTLYSAVFDPSNFNLGQGNSQLPYSRCTAIDWTLGGGQACATAPGYRGVYSYKTDYMDLARRNGFYYSVFANKQYDNQGSSGLGEVNGNDFVVNLGQTQTNRTSTFNTNYIINTQTGTLLHEWGHNTGLLHGGNDNINYKPNYLSVMNYLYFNGVGPSEGPGYIFNPASRATLIPGDRYYASKYSGGPPEVIWHNIKFTNDVTNSLVDSYLTFNTKYSTGAGTSINEAAINEAAGLGRVKITPANRIDVDFNNSGALDAGTYALDVNNDGTPNQVLTDYNDLANMSFAFVLKRDAVDPFRPLPDGVLRPVKVGYFDPMGLDEQPVADEPVMPTTRIPFVP